MPLAAASPTEFNRRKLLARAASLGATLGIATLAGGMLAGCSETPPLRIALHPWPGYQFMTLASRLGWVAPKDVNLMITSGFPETVAALKSGEVDGAGLTLDEVLSLREQGMPLQILLVFNVSAGADMVLAKPPVQSLAQLKGLRIGVEASSLGEVMLAKTLETAGLSRSDVVVVPMTDDHEPAWMQGGMEAIITYEPSAASLRQKGLVSLFDSRAIPQLIVDVFVVKSNIVTTHGKALRALISGHFRAQDLWRRNPADASYQLGGLLNLAPEQVPEVFRGIDLPDRLYNRRYLTPPATEMVNAASEVGRIMHRAGLLKATPNLQELFVSEFLTAES